MNTEEELKLEIGKSYVLRNGMKTGPLRMFELNSRYCYEANIPQENGPDYIFQFKSNGRFLTDFFDNRFDIIKKQDNENT